MDFLDKIVPAKMVPRQMQSAPNVPSLSDSISTYTTSSVVSQLHPGPPPVGISPPTSSSIQDTSQPSGFFSMSRRTMILLAVVIVLVFFYLRYGNMMSDLSFTHALAAALPFGTHIMSLISGIPAKRLRRQIDFYERGVVDKDEEDDEQQQQQEQPKSPKEKKVRFEEKPDLVDRLLK